MDITTATPVEIDTALAEIMNKAASLLAQYEYEIAAAREIEAGVRKFEAGDRRYSGWSLDKADVHREKADKINTQILILDEEARPLNDEFERRGGWTRAFLAQSSNGHIHSSRSCSTCYVTTGFFWFTDLSGHDEAEIVTKAGSDACTVCYPSAPVNDLKRPRSIFSDDEKAAQQAREERAAAKAAKDAATVTFSWTEYGRTKDKTFKTLRGATNALAADLYSLCWYGVEHPDATSWLANVTAGREALGDAWDYDKALAAARKKSVKEAGEYLHQTVTGFDPATRSYITEWSDAPLYPKF